MKPLICISTSTNYEKNVNKTRELRIPHTYPDALANAGAIPVLTAERCPEELARTMDALFLSGGVDMDPVYFGEPVLNDTVEIDPGRDVFEDALCRAFLKENKPILAVCRGIQVLNIVLGGDIYQDLPSQCGVMHSDSALRHPVNAKEGSVLRELFGARFSTNSTHHQALRKLGEGLYVTAYADDGVIEACQHEERLIWATQFHPERLCGAQLQKEVPDFQPYFDAFVRAVSDRKRK